MRTYKPSQRYPPSYYILLTNKGEPECFQVACKVQTLEESNGGRNGLSIEKQNLGISKASKRRNIPQNKWVYKIKHEGEGKKERYKARLVVKGFAEKEGIEFTKKNSLVVKMSSIRVILGLVAALDLECEQLDVKKTFLHGDLKEEIYMEQPDGFKERGKENLVCKLKKSLYGLKQGPCQWYNKFDSFIGT